MRVLEYRFRLSGNTQQSCVGRETREFDLAQGRNSAPLLRNCMATADELRGMAHARASLDPAKKQKSEVGRRLLNKPGNCGAVTSSCSVHAEIDQHAKGDCHGCRPYESGKK